jgi:4-amino-4-deoxy-L-arabinose transferase-like glycosyltransferase
VRAEPAGIRESSPGVDTAGRGVAAPSSGPVSRRFAARARKTLDDRLLIAILALAFVVRLTVVAFSRHFKPVADPADYDRIAVSLAHGHGFGATALAQPGTASALRPPLYPLMLAATYRIVGHSWTAARALEAVLGVAFVLLLFLLARRLYGRRVALVAAALAAIMPTLVVLNASLLSETLFLPLEIAALLAAVAWRQTPALRFAVGAGVACGAAVLTRSVGIAVLVSVIVAIVTASAPWRVRLRAAAVVAGIAIALVLPWTIRNAVELHAFVPVSTQGGPTAAGVYNSVTFSDQKYYAVWHPPFFLRQFQPLFYDGINEAQLDSRLSHSALRYARGHPGDVATAVGLNTVRLFFDAGRGHVVVAHLWYDEGAVSRWLQPPLGWAVRLLTLIVLIVLVAALARRVRIGYWYLWVAPLLLYLAVIPFHGGNRYGAPVTPFLILVAAVGIASGWRQVAPAARLRRLR